MSIRKKRFKRKRKVIELAEFQFIRGPAASVRLPSGDLLDLERIRCGDCWPVVLFTGNRRRRADYDYEPLPGYEGEQSFCPVGDGSCSQRDCGLALAERIAEEFKCRSGDDRANEAFDRANVALKRHIADPAAHQGGYAAGVGIDMCPICADARGLIIGILRGDLVDVGGRGVRLRMWSIEHAARIGAPNAEQSRCAAEERTLKAEAMAAQGVDDKGTVAAGQDAAGLPDAAVIEGRRARGHEDAYREANLSERPTTCPAPKAHSPGELCGNPLRPRQKHCSQACRQRVRRHRLKQ